MNESTKENNGQNTRKMMETCLFSLGTAENLEALPPLLQLENIFVLSPSPPVRILKSNAKCMCQERSHNSRNQFYYRTPMSYKKHCTKKDLLVHVLVALGFFCHLTFQKTEQIFLFLHIEKGGKKNSKPGLSRFCLSRFSSKCYSPFDLLLIYCKTIACYARVVSSCRTKALQHRSLQFKLFSFGKCRGYS